MGVISAIGIFFVGVLPLFALLAYWSVQGRRARKLCGAGVCAASLLSGYSFYYMQTVLNTPDYGRALSQFYLPLAGYGLLFLLGIFLLLRQRSAS